MRAIGGGSRYVFPGRNPDKPISNNTMLFALYRLGYKGKMTGHGFRAVASTILNEAGFRADVIERQLAHCERNEIRGAYNRAEYLPERRAMMQQWADMLDALAQGRAGDPVAAQGKVTAQSTPRLARRSGCGDRHREAGCTPDCTIQRKPPTNTSRSGTVGSSLDALRSKPVLTLREAASLLLSRTGDRYKASPELRNLVQRMRDAKGRRELVIKGDPLRVTRAALNEWARRVDRGWAKNLGVAFRDQITCVSVVQVVSESDVTTRPAPQNLRGHYDRVAAENEELRAQLAEREAEVQKLSKKPGRPPKKFLQKDN